jgi:7-cyano-7-deazaguanine synthase
VKGPESIAVLLSGGLDSAILAARLADRYSRVFPLYVRCGFVWEEAEEWHARRFLEALDRPGFADLRAFDMPVGDLLADHWSVTGDGVPDGHTPDEAVFLPGRNVLLLAKPALWCHRNEVGRLALGPLKSNPFPDSTPAFYEAYQAALNQAVKGNLQVLRPLERLTKSDVMRMGRDLPLEQTFSCIHPVDRLHCGRCNKCAERRGAFRSVDLADPTCYADSTG